MFLGAASGGIGVSEGGRVRHGALLDLEVRYAPPVGCDVLARTLVAPVEIPVGVITALIGGPFFLWLLVRKA